MDQGLAIEAEFRALPARGANPASSSRSRCAVQNRQAACARGQQAEAERGQERQA